MSDLKKAISGLEAVALACETVTKAVTLAGTDMRDHAADIRAVVAQLASAEAEKHRLLAQLATMHDEREAAEARLRAVTEAADAMLAWIDAVVRGGNAAPDCIARYEAARAQAGKEAAR